MSNNKDYQHGETKKKPAESAQPVKAETPCGLKVDVGMELSCPCVTCKAARSAGA